MKKILTKHFQYTGMDDYDTAIDIQINEFVEKEKISPESLVDIKYGGQFTDGVITYSALLIYKKA